jgi:hypothetical protein
MARLEGFLRKSQLVSADNDCLCQTSGWRSQAVRRYAFCLAVYLSVSVSFAESVIYPSVPQMSRLEWLQLRAQIMGQADVECLARTPQVQRCASDVLRTIWWMTEVGHEAHPAMVRQALVRKDGSVVLETSGYFAGDQGAFRRWYTAVLRDDQRELQSIVRKLPTDKR